MAVQKSLRPLRATEDLGSDSACKGSQLLLVSAVLTVDLVGHASDHAHLLAVDRRPELLLQIP